MKNLSLLHQFMKNPTVFLDSVNTRGLKALTLGPKRFIFIFDPALSYDILNNRPETFVQNRTIFDRIKPITGNKGLVQLNGDESKFFREKFAPMFRPDNMNRMKNEILKNSQSAFANIRPNTQIDITSIMTDLVLKNAFKIFMGLDLLNETKMIAEDFQELNELCGKRMVAALPLPLFIPTKKNRRILFLQDNLRSQIAKVLKENHGDLETIPKLFSGDKTLIDQCMTFLFAGHETTASSLSFTFLLLAKHPEYIKQIADGNDQMAMLSYKESLRMFPPAYMLAREAAADTELSGEKIKKGDQIIVAVKQIQNNPDFHKNPEQFYPERFLSANSAFFPFGLGPKACIGEGLAYMEAITIIKAFCKKFDFTSDHEAIESFPLVTLHPKKGQMITIKRLHHE